MQASLWETTLTDDLLDRMIDHAELWMDDNNRQPQRRADRRWSWTGGPLWRQYSNGLPPELWLHICTAEADARPMLCYATRIEAVNDLAAALLAFKVFGPAEDVSQLPAVRRCA